MVWEAKPFFELSKQFEGRISQKKRRGIWQCSVMTALGRFHSALALGNPSNIKVYGRWTDIGSSSQGKTVHSYSDDDGRFYDKLSPAGDTKGAEALIRGHRGS